MLAQEAALNPRILPVIAPLTFLMLSCSSGPEPPAKGTPAFYWSAAKESYNSGDYLKTVDHLAKVAGTENEFRTQAVPWRLVLVGGMSKGYADLADQYEYGARSNKSNPAPFRKQTSALRSDASRLALDFAETLAAFQKIQATGDVNITFPYPPLGSAKEVISRASAGILPEQAEADAVRAQYIQRDVLLAACRALGNGADAGKTKEMLSKGLVTVPRDTFLRAMAESMYEQSTIFGHTKLDMPDREKLFKERALAALDGLPDSKDLKDLRAKIQANDKKKKS